LTFSSLWADTLGHDLGTPHLSSMNFELSIMEVCFEDSFLTTAPEEMGSRSN
jgi:hypothetical protein